MLDIPEDVTTNSSEASATSLFMPRFSSENLDVTNRTAKVYAHKLTIEDANATLLLISPTIENGKN